MDGWVTVYKFGFCKRLMDWNTFIQQEKIKMIKSNRNNFNVVRISISN